VRISSDAFISGITFTGADNQPWTPTFAPNVYNYKVNTNPASGSFQFNISQQWSLARTNYTYNGGDSTPISVGPPSTSLTLLMADSAPLGINTLTLLVYAEDRITYNVYTLKIHRISNDAVIRFFTPDPLSAVLVHDIPVNSFKTTVPNSQLSFSVIVDLSSAYIY
jgi:hypothetical protein